MVIMEIGKMKKYILGCIVLFFLSLGLTTTTLAKEYSNKELEQVADKIIDWQTKKSDETTIFDSGLLLEAGSNSSDWFAIGVSRLGKEANYLDYQALLSENVEKRYQTSHLLSVGKATEWHRIGLAYLASGGNPTDLSFDGKKKINLINDGTYNRGETKPLAAQGTNGLIFGLILLDSMNYEIPEKAKDTRKDIITELLSAQNEDGGFPLAKETDSDVDITAMALTSLAPYYNSEEQFKLKNNKSIQAKEAIERGLTYLSNSQNKEGGFESWGTPNPESATQVILALTALNINPQKDERFIKNNHNLIDFLLTFQMKDGGFVHSFEYDEENPSAKPDESNAMASEQVLTALGSLIREQNKMRHFYDFRPEMTKEIASQVTQVNEKITDLSDKNDVIEVYKDYSQLPIEEKRYVKNYRLLSEKIKIFDIPVEQNDFTSSNIGKSLNQSGTITNVSTKKEVSLNEDISEKMEQVKKIERKDLSLSDLPLVYSTYYLAQKEDVSESDLKLLKDMMKQLEERQGTIDKISEQIKKEYYPMDKLGAKDYFRIKKTMKSLDELSEENRRLVFGYEDLEKTVAHATSLIRSAVISVIVLFVIIIGLLVLAKNRKKRKKEKYDKMMMSDDDDEEYEDE